MPVGADSARHCLEHLYAERSPHFGSDGSWAGQDARRAGHLPSGHVLPIGWLGAPYGDRPRHRNR